VHFSEFNPLCPHLPPPCSIGVELCNSLINYSNITITLLSLYRRKVGTVGTVEIPEVLPGFFSVPL